MNARASEEDRYSFLADAVPLILWTARPDGCLDYYNKAWFEYTGLTFAQTKDWGWGAVIHPDDLERVAERWTRSFTSGESYEIEYRFKRGCDGVYRWFLGRASARRGEAGEILQWVGTCTDIDDQKCAHAELDRRVAERTAELAQSTQFLHSTLDALSSHIAILDEQGTIIEVNDAWNRFALDNEGQAGRCGGGANYLAVCDAARFCADGVAVGLGIRAVMTGQVEEFQLEYSCHSPREQRWFIARATRFRGGGPLRVVVAHENITQRKQAETARQRLAAILDATTDLVSFSSPAGNLLYLNQAGRTLLGVGREEDISKLAITDFISDPATHPIMTEGIPAAIRQGSWAGETVLLSRAGQDIPVSQVILAHKTASGELEFLSTITRDISARHRAHEELQAKTALLEAQMNSSIDGILIVDNEGNKLVQNQRLIELWDLPPEIASESSNERQLQFVISQTTNPDRFAEQVHYLYAHPNESSRDEIEFRNGTVLDRNSAPVVGGEGKLYGRIWWFRDITARKRSEAELLKTHRELLDASRQAGMAEVAAEVLHNVGNVLTSVNVSATIIADQVRQSGSSNIQKLAALFEEQASDLPAFLMTDPRGQMIPGYLASLAESLVIERQATLGELDNLRNNIDHIMEIVAMQQSYARTSWIVESVSVSELADEALRLNAAAFDHHGVETRRDYHALATLRTDRHRVMQILINLLRNAKHACDASGRADKQITLRTTSDECTVRIAVIDNGIGIPPENLTLIFNHGFTTRKDGHGFGLHSGAIAAKELGGNLRALSEGPGLGATFTLELPIHE